MGPVGGASKSCFFLRKPLPSEHLLARLCLHLLIFELSSYSSFLGLVKQSTTHWTAEAQESIVPQFWRLEVQDHSITGLVPSEADSFPSLLASSGLLAVAGIPVPITFPLSACVSVPTLPCSVGTPVIWDWGPRSMTSSKLNHLERSYFQIRSPS